MASGYYIKDGFYEYGIGVFYVSRHGEEFRILKHELTYARRAYIWTAPFEKELIKIFDNLEEAIQFLKNNINRLM